MEHCPDGIFNVKQYGQITIKNIYPGIDWVLRTEGKKGLTYDFILHPGAKLEQIKLSYPEAKKIELLENKSKLKVTTPLGEITEGNLLCYEKNSQKKISSSFNFSGLGR